MKRILLVEDEPEIARLVQFKLEREGLGVTWVDDGQKALERAQHEPFDLILLDGMMPKLDGFQTLQAIRQDPKLKATPVVMLTAVGQERDVRRGLQLGAADYIVKPFNPQELFERIRRVLEKTQNSSHEPC